MKAPTKYELAWLAGLFDGEGCISAAGIGRSGLPLIHVNIAQSNPTKSLREIQEWFGGRMDANQLSFRREEMKVLLPAILPYLRFKRKRAKLALHLLNRPKHRGGPGKGVPDEERETRQRIAARITELNKGGAL